MKYTSIQRNYRGFFYDRDYEDMESFNAEMAEDHADRSEICWAHLFNDSGDMVATYKRGYTMAEYIKEGE